MFKLQAQDKAGCCAMRAWMEAWAPVWVHESPVCTERPVFLTWRPATTPDLKSQRTGRAVCGSTGHTRVCLVFDFTGINQSSPFSFDNNNKFRVIITIIINHSYYLVISTGFIFIKISLICFINLFRTDVFIFTIINNIASF